MATVISWKVPNLFKADAEKCYAEIGTEDISPNSVLEKARDENTELHKCFEWDNTIAGEKYRLIQARRVIQLMVVRTVDDETKKEDKTVCPSRVFQISSEQREYKPVSFFVEHEDEHQILLKRAYREAEAFANRYRNLAELEDVIEAIENLI